MRYNACVFNGIVGLDLTKNDAWDHRLLENIHYREMTEILAVSRTSL